MKKSFFLLVLVIIASASHVVRAAEDCAVLAVNDLFDGTWEISLSKTNLIYFDGPWVFLEGTNYEGISRPIREEGDILIVTLIDRTEGEYVYFSYGRGYSYWTGSGCSKFNYDYFFRVPLVQYPEKSTQLIFLPLLLL